jgi:RNA polymerase sigma factor (sigma-70 family)
MQSKDATQKDHSTDAPPSGNDVSALADHLFRNEAGKLVSVLTGIFGIERLQLAEDVVQEALARALQTWPYYGVPKNPAAWITQTAKNLALDIIRREKNFREKEPEITATFEHAGAGSVSGDSPLFDDEIKDDRLRLMFACCHPLISQEAQTALALKTLCGFSPAEIAKAFLTTEAAIAKRLTRARQKISESGIRFEIPAGEELTKRLAAVLHTLYLLFNEGYKASSGENLLREDLCYEAIHLALLVSEHPAGDQPRTHALVALMFLNAARFAARIDTQGNILRLKEQDRSLWDRSMIQRGILHLGRSATGEELTEYHLQAAIAACHCTAPNYESTDWPQIFSLYDRLVQIDDSPVVALNRAVALAQVDGPEVGMKAVEAIRNCESLGGYYLYYAVLAELCAELNDFSAASDHCRKAIQLTDIPSERAFLSKRLEAYERPADYQRSFPGRYSAIKSS